VGISVAGAVQDPRKDVISMRDLFPTRILLRVTEPEHVAYTSSRKVTARFWAGRNRDPDTSRVMAGPGWAIDPLPGLSDLGGAA